MPGTMFDSNQLKGPPPDYEAATSFSHPPQSTPSPSTPSQLSCFSINGYDSIRLIGFSQSDISAIHAVIRDTWAKGIESVHSLAGAREIKLKGTPWIPNLKGDDESRKLILIVVEKLHELGWVACASVRFTLRLAVDKGKLAIYPTCMISASYTTLQDPCSSVNSHRCLPQNSSSPCHSTTLINSRS